MPNVSCRLLVLLLAVVNAEPRRAEAQPQRPERAVRRDVPTPDAIHRARAAGTRERSGRPGKRYWQLWTDYTIRARLDPTTSIVTGSETIRLRNDADVPLAAIQLRLDQNIFRPESPRDAAIGETTDGMVLRRVTVDGQSVRLPTENAGAGAPASLPALSGIAGTAERTRI